MAKSARHSKKTYRVILVDDHPIVREGLASLINQQPDLEVCAEASNAERAMELVLETSPDLAVVDISLGRTNGLTLVKDLKVKRPNTPVLVLSMHDEPVFVERALRAGATGYVTKQEDPAVLLTAIRRMLDGDVFVSEKLGSAMLRGLVTATRKKSSSAMDTLSDREFEVFSMIGQGLGVREIAEHLCRSVKTVETHRENIKKKLGLASAAELARYSFRWMQGDTA